LGLSFSRSVRFGPVRFNFSSSGIGVSTGIRGLRIGTGPRGAYINVGRGGLRYRASLSGKSWKTPKSPREFQGPGAPHYADPLPQEGSNLTQTKEHDNVSVLELTESSSDALLQSMNEQAKRQNLWPFVGGGILVLFFLGYQFLQSWPTWAQLLILGVGAGVTLWVRHRDGLKKLTVLFFDPDPDTVNRYTHVVSGAQSASTARKLRSVLQTSTYADPKYQAGASQGLKLGDASIVIGQMPNVLANIDIPIITSGRTTLGFYPDRVLAFQGQAVGAIEYRDLSIESSPSKYIEMESVPTDAMLIDWTWQYVNKSGGPDKRFKDNRKIPICKYNGLQLVSNRGLDIRLLSSRDGAFDQFAGAVKSLSALAQSEPVKVVPTVDRERPKPLPYQATPSPVAPTAPVALSPFPTAKPSSYRIPKAPKGYGKATWVPAGESIQIAGHTIVGGMLYVGSSLPTPSGENDPSLIDPSKPVADKGDFTERQTGYWPSYSHITPAARAAYLHWLADGRRNPEADIGYVFLFFYGLERRALVDSKANADAKQDWPQIKEELLELLSVYGASSGSFGNYARNLLNLLQFADYPPKLYEAPIPSFSRASELPLHLRVALGQAAADGVPVPARLALEWVRLAPDVYLRTPTVRCAKQFEMLFIEKYSQIFGAGIALPCNKTKLKFVYRPASAGFHGYQEIKLSFGDIPDVAVLTGPIKKLFPIVEEATKELAPYSRFIGRNPESASSLEALLQLPPALWPENVQSAFQDLKTRMGSGNVMLTFQGLLGALEAKTTLTKDKIASLARALEAMSIGMEPDVIGGAKAPKPEDKIVLFNVPAGEQSLRSTPAYLAALVTLQLCAAVAAANGEFGKEEAKHLREQVVSWSHLKLNDRRRLLAQLRLLSTAPVPLSTLKKKLEPLAPAARETIAGFIATVAQTAGMVTPAEVSMLERVYRTLGVEPKKVFSDIHSVAAGGASDVRRKDEEAGFKLDAAKIIALQQDSEKVSKLLANIFKEENAAVNVPPVEPEPEANEAAPVGLLGLDAAHSAFVRVLLSRPDWTREELLDVASDMELMLDGALERVNEASFDKIDMAITDGENPVIINNEVLERIVA
jgi:uncharacterized tellurite resistance protein B-like protein